MLQLMRPHPTPQQSDVNSHGCFEIRTAALLAARALIPDDDDEELIEKAKANRKSRLQTEKAAEKEYAKSGGFADSEVVAVQVRKL